MWHRNNSNTSGNPRKRLRRRALREELHTVRNELEAVEPYTGLAREIERAVAGIVLSETAQAHAIGEVFDAMLAEKRRRAAIAIFNTLPKENQWQIIADTFGDEEMKGILQSHHGSAKAELESRALAESMNQKAALETERIPAHSRLTLGLFMESEVQSALRRGQQAQHCARRLTLVVTEQAGVLSVVTDEFNPNKAYFLTSQYDHDVWRAQDMLPSHSLVRLGSIRNSGGSVSFDPIVYPGGRVDFEVDGQPINGKLHLGYAVLGGEDIFRQNIIDN